MSRSIFPVEETFLICFPGKGGGSAGGQGSEGIQTLINWVSNLKIWDQQIFSIIEEPFFKQRGLNKFGII